MQWVHQNAAHLAPFNVAPTPAMKAHLQEPPGTLGSIWKLYGNARHDGSRHPDYVYSYFVRLNCYVIWAVTVFTVLGVFISRHFIYAYSLHIFNFHRVLSFSSANYPLCEYERVSEHTYVHFLNFFVPLSLLFSRLILLITHLCAFLCFLCD